MLPWKRKLVIEEITYVTMATKLICCYEFCILVIIVSPCYVLQYTRVYYM